MNDGLETAHRRGIVHHARGKQRAINPPIDDDAGKGGFDDWNAAPRVKGVNGGVGIMHGCARAFEQGRRGRLAHANRTCQSDNDHRRIPSNLPQPMM